MRLITPQWIDSSPSVILCNQCHNAIRRGERLLRDSTAKANGNCPVLCGTCGQKAMEAYAKRTIKHNREIQAVENCTHCHAPYPLMYSYEDAFQAITRGCCYVCDAPLTAEAKRVDRQEWDRWFVATDQQCLPMIDTVLAA